MTNYTLRFITQAERVCHTQHLDAEGDQVALDYAVFLTIPGTRVEVWTVDEPALCRNVLYNRGLIADPL